MWYTWNCRFSKTSKRQKRIYLFDVIKSDSYRGPDDSGEFNDEFISMGFRRLSILDIEKGNQPVTNKNKKIISIFNGEIFNFKEIRNELKIKGFNFKTNSDSEIIPYAYEVWGINFVKRLNGMFSIAIYDKSKNFFI